MEQIELFSHVIKILEELGTPYMVVGSFASALYGEPRMTRDIDIVVQLDRGQVEKLCAAFPPEDYYISCEAAVEALRYESQFNVIHGSSGNKIDFMIAHSDKLGKEQLSRRKSMELMPGLHGYIASPADVIIGKLIYYKDGGSDKHLRDITGIMKISGDDVDRDVVARWARELGASEVWEAILADLE